MAAHSSRRLSVMFPTALEVSIALEPHTISSLSRVNFRRTHPQFGVYWQLGGGEAGKIHRSLREDLGTEGSLDSSQRSKASPKGLIWKRLAFSVPVTIRLG